MGKSKRPLSLRQISRCQIHSNAPGRKIEVGIDQGGAYPVLAFLHLCFRQPYDGKTGQPIGQMNLYGYQRGVHAA
jgi:hypothetical protein